MLHSLWGISHCWLSSPSLHGVTPLAALPGSSRWLFQLGGTSGSASTNPLTYFWLEICSVSRGTYLREQLLAACPAPCTSCTSPEHQTHTGAFTVLTQSAGTAQYWNIFLLCLNRAAIHFLSPRQVDEDKNKITISSPSERISLLQNTGLLHGGTWLLYGKCTRGKSEMPVCKGVSRPSRNYLNHMAMRVIPVHRKLA